MSVILAEELFAIATAGAYMRLPDIIYSLLSDLEKQLEITETDDSVAAPSRFVDSDPKVRHFRRQDNPQKKPFNRREVDAKLKRGEKKHSEAADAETWTAVRQFKPSKIEKKTGIEKTINDIRIALNKMSPANYEKQKDAIIALLALIDDDESNSREQSSPEYSANINLVCKTLFDIASTNKFYSEMYANLYKELIQSRESFRTLLNEFVAGIILNVESIPDYVDPDINYDGFCVYLKECEKRKATSSFLVNCANTGLLELSQITDILSKYLDYINNNHAAGKEKLVEEVVENVFIISTQSTVKVRKLEQWNGAVLPLIKKFATEKCEGISNRAKFKCMDMLDALTKK